MRTVGICINARLSSSRCPKKLIRDFGGSTLINIALDKLSKINVEEKCLAAGDDEIINIHRQYKNVKLLKRGNDAIAPGEHDHSVSFRHYADMKSEYIFIMNPCLPFTRISTYEKAINYFINSDFDSVTSVLEFKDIFFNDDGDIINLPNIHHVSSTTSERLYKMAHIFHIINKQYFLNNGKIWSYSKGDPSFFKVDQKECLDIDDEEDFLFCEKLYLNGLR